MSNEKLSLKKWIQDALSNAERVAIENKKHGLSDYDRGRVHGKITAYHHVLVELRSINERKTECKSECDIFDTWVSDIFDTWVSDVCEASPLTAGGAIEIYMFLDKENIPITDPLLRFVIQLSLSGKDRYEITQVLNYEKLKDRAKKHRWTWRWE